MACMNDYFINLGEAVRYARKKVNKTQFQLSDELGMNKNYIGDVERGEIIPSLQKLKQIAIACDTTISQVMFDAKL